jgi:hypothetical protein
MRMRLEEYTKERLWPVLMDTVHAMPMYFHHKAYIKEVILHEKPDIKPNELAARLKVPLGEALVTLYELTNERKLES